MSYPHTLKNLLQRQQTVSDEIQRMEMIAAHSEGEALDQNMDILDSLVEEKQELFDIISILNMAKEIEKPFRRGNGPRRYQVREED